MKISSFTTKNLYKDKQILFTMQDLFYNFDKN